MTQEAKMTIVTEPLKETRKKLGSDTQDLIIVKTFSTGLNY